MTQQGNESDDCNRHDRLYAHLNASHYPRQMSEPTNTCQNNKNKKRDIQNLKAIISPHYGCNAGNHVILMDAAIH